MEIFDSEALADFDGKEEIKAVVPVKEPKDKETKETTHIETPVNTIDTDTFANEEDEFIPPVEAKSEGKNQEPPKTSEGSPSSQLVFLASALYEEGVFSSITEEDIKNVKETKDLFELFRKEKEEFKKSGLNEDQLNYLKAMEKGVPFESYTQKKSIAARYDAITNEHLESNPALRQEIIKRDFLVKGYSEEDAIRFTKRSIESKEDLEDAKAATERLKVYTKGLLDKEIADKEAEVNKTAEEETKKLESLKTKISETKEIIPGITVNAKTHEKVYNSITTASKVKEGKPLNDFQKKYAEDDDFKIKVHYLAEITNDFKDFSKLKNIEKTKAVKEFERTLSSGAAIVSKSPNNYSNTVSKTSKDLISAITEQF